MIERSTKLSRQAPSLSTGLQRDHAPQSCGGRDATRVWSQAEATKLARIKIVLLLLCSGQLYVVLSATSTFPSMQSTSYEKTLVHALRIVPVDMFDDCPIPV